MANETTEREKTMTSTTTETAYLSASATMTTDQAHETMAALENDTRDVGPFELRAAFVALMGRVPTSRDTTAGLRVTMRRAGVL